MGVLVEGRRRRRERGGFVYIRYYVENGTKLFLASGCVHGFDMPWEVKHDTLCTMGESDLLPDEGLACLKACVDHFSDCSNISRGPRPNIHSLIPLLCQTPRRYHAAFTPQPTNAAKRHHHSSHPHEPLHISQPLNHALSTPLPHCLPNASLSPTNFSATTSHRSIKSSSPFSSASNAVPSYVWMRMFIFGSEGWGIE